MAKQGATVPEYTVEEQRAISARQLVAKPGDAPGRPQDPLYQQRFSTMSRRLAHTKTVPATIINCLPVTLVVNSAMPDLKRRIAACSLNEEFTAWCWNEQIVEAVVAEGVRLPIDYVPRQMAEEYLREYSGEEGPIGVMIFDGTIEQFLIAKEKDPEIARELDAAKDAAVHWMTGKYIDANNSWNTPNHQLAANISQVHRDCAARLKHLGRLPENVDPEWMDLRALTQNATKPCPVCRTVPKPGALVCTTGSCNYVFDVAGAFNEHLIDEYSPLLERLTRKQVEELSLSAFVAETADEIGPRLKAGKPKPMSQVAQEQMREQQNMQQMPMQ